MLFSKSKLVIQKLNAHSSKVRECFQQYLQIFDEFTLQQNEILSDESRMEVYVEQIKKLEEEADEVRHVVIRELLSGGLLLENRKSSVRLIEGLDQVANMAEDIIQMLFYEGICVEEFMIKDIKEINSITLVQLDLFISLLSRTMTKYEESVLLEDITKVESYEAQVDDLENALIKQIYRLPIELAKKNQYKDLLRLVAGISNLIEDLSDEIEIIAAIRRA